MATSVDLATANALQCVHIPLQNYSSTGHLLQGMFAKDKAELLPAQKVNPMNLRLEMLWAVHLTQMYRAHWTQSTQLAWPEEN